MVILQPPLDLKKEPGNLAQLFLVLNLLRESFYFKVTNFTESEFEYSMPRTLMWALLFFKFLFSNSFSLSFLLHQGELHRENMMVIPEVVEIKATAEHLSRSFDDNSEFERAEECAEDTGES